MTLTKSEWGLAVNSGLYTAGCFVAGLVTGHGIAWRLALAAFAVRTLAFMADDRMIKPSLSLWLGQAATVVGVLAGLALLYPW